MADDINTVDYQVHDNSDTDSSVLQAADKHYAMGNYNEAYNLLQNSIHTNPSSNLYLNMGNCLYKLNRFEEAFADWQRAIDLNSKNSQAYANIGKLYYRNGEIERAVSYWVVALITRPEDAMTCLNLAIAYKNKNMRFDAIKYYEKYLKYALDKNSEDYKTVKLNIQRSYAVANEYLKLGAELQSNNDDKKAAACYFKSLANYPNLSKTNMNLGSIFFKDKNLELAIKYWKAASYIDSKYDKLYSNLALSYDLASRFDYAYCYYNRYLNLVINDRVAYDKANQRMLKLKPHINRNPELVNKHLKLAQENLSNANFYEAIEEFENYIILNPLAKPEYKDVISKIKTYIEPELEIIKTCFELGDEALRQKQYSSAKDYFYRIMVLSSPQYLEFSKAKAKYAQCEKKMYDEI